MRIWQRRTVKADADRRPVSSVARSSAVSGRTNKGVCIPKSIPHAQRPLLDLYSALCTEGSVCSGLSMAFAVYRHRSPVCATAAMDMGSPRLALNRADDELGVTR